MGDNLFKKEFIHLCFSVIAFYCDSHFLSQNPRKPPTRRLFKKKLFLGGMFSWKIIGVLVEIWKRPSWKIGAVLA